MTHDAKRSHLTFSSPGEAAPEVVEVDPQLPPNAEEIIAEVTTPSLKLDAAQLPLAWRPEIDRFIGALGVPEFAVVDGITFAPQAKGIANVIVDLQGSHKHLRDAVVVCVFVEKLAEGYAGKAHKATPMENYLGDGVDWIIKLSWEVWKQLDARHRIALVDHELCHCGPEKARRHDVEEFTQIVGRWGPWTSKLVSFYEAVEQLDFGI